MNASVSICFVFLFSSIVLQAQVSNNNISSLIKLELHAPPYASHTQHNTVEWNCINKKLTEKCLVYHNDQWFSFIPINDKIVYLNVGKQICKNKYGVQVLVLRGNPCEKLSYELIHCESFTNQSDTYIALRNLIANETYLINIDGFLGDLCSFEIAISDKPKGLPVASQIKYVNTKTKIENQNRKVLLIWTLPELLQDSVASFKIDRMKTGDKKPTEVRRVSALGNAAGTYQSQYVVNDSLPEFGKYQYKIYAVSPEENQFWLLVDELFNFKDERDFIPLTISNEFKDKEDVTLTIYDEASGKLLKHNNCIRCIEKQFIINTASWLQQNMYRFKVILANQNSGLVKEELWDYDAQKGIFKKHKN
ncbi:MAG: hypothetical protein O9302_15675 [Cyclobacteriaceae bacterium]|jgi:hypothetical protein|nr:hypothetical protein [Cytophagales bacterium]MCZ8329503.1 hypothetical protein [Cyclobacteriaceae bacterium]